MAAAAADAGMDAKLFADLLKQLKETSFSSAKESLIELAVTTNAFSVAQAVQIVGEFSFSADKEKVAVALKDHLVDPQHKDKLTGLFSGSAKTKIEAEYKAVKPKAALHIPPALLLPNAALRDEKAFSALVEAVKKESFSSGKIDVLKAELKAHSEGFSGAQTVAVLKLFTMSSDMVTAVKLLDDHILGLTCAEVNAILGVFSFSSDRLTVLPLLKDTILDGQLKHTILNEFAMSSDKEKAAEILKSVKAAVPPRSPLFGTVRALNAVFVIDVSGSMDAAFKHTTGETLTRLQLAVRELKNVVNEHLAANAVFNIIFFSTAVHTVFKEPVTATPANREAACKALNALKPNGSTNAAGALKAAFDMKAADAIYFLTDGEPDTPAAGIVAQVQGYVKAHAVPIFGIFLGLPGKVPKARQFVLDLTRTSNGVFRAFE